MAATSSLEWRRRFPARAVRRLSWYVIGGGCLTAIGWLLFGAEPDRLESGEPNPLALVPLTTALLVAAGSMPLLLAVLRRPKVGADHYALRIRPGSLRTLLLPWAVVAELVVVTTGDEPLLLVRCHPVGGRSADRPRWYDRGVLRSAGRPGHGFDLAVRLDDFAGATDDRLAALASWAPHQVGLTDAR